MGVLALVACGGGKPPADAATAKTGPAPGAPTTAAAPSASAGPASDGGPTAAPGAAPSAATSAAIEPPSAPAEPPPETRHVVDELTAPSVAYTLDYGGSGPKQLAEKACAGKADDPQARAACMEKERGRFLADVLVFTKDAQGVTWTIYRRNGNNLAEVSRSAIDFKDETGNGVSIHIKKDKGWRPLFAGTKSVVLAAPPGSNIEFQDPTWGHLVYEAKIGLVNQ